MKQPFCASVFTLAAHPPYNLPEQYRKTLPAGPLPVYQCMAYTDMALRKFFATAAQQPWYDSTLFIITSDHTSPQNSGGFYKQGMGLYAIPMLFYCPGDTSLRGYYDEPVQQLDILPSTLQYLGYSQPFFAFGNSLFEAREPRFVMTHNSGFYQWLQGGHLLQYDGNNAKAFYAYPADSSSRTNLIRQPIPAKDSALKNLQAFIQRYRHALIHNAMQ
jgi:phosphoglycerol transferase MdoB-like AlkP superfamily enzyme